MLLFLNIAQLILYIGALGLIGQGLLYVLAGQGRDTNLFYQLIRYFYLLLCQQLLIVQ